MKCERCGNEAVRQEGNLLRNPHGGEAVVTLTYKGVKALLQARVCKSCADLLRERGWKL